MRFSLYFLLFSLTNVLVGQETGFKEFPSLGISFQIPDGWAGQESDAGYIMGSYTEPGILMAMAHQTTDMGQLKTEAQAGIADQQGTQLSIDGQVVDFQSNGIAAQYQGSISWQPAKAYAVSLINPHGTGVTFLYMTTKEMFKASAIDLVKKVAQSVAFKKVATPVANLPGNGATNWQSKFQNARLTYMNSYYSSGGSYGGYSTGGGYSDKEVIDLCAQGHFKFYSSSSMSVDTGGAFANSNDRNKGSGTWKIAKNQHGQNILQLNFYNGQVKEYGLSLEDGKTFLNGYRYFCTYGQVADDGPECF